MPRTGRPLSMRGWNGTASPRLQPDRCRHVLDVGRVVRVALDGLEDPPPVPFLQGLDGEDERRRPGAMAWRFRRSPSPVDFHAGLDGEDEDAARRLQVPEITQHVGRHDELVLRVQPAFVEL